MLPLLFAAVVPAAFTLGRIFQSSGRWSALIRAGVAGVLIMCARSAGQFYGNKAEASYVTMNANLDASVEWIKNNVPEGSRMLFAGKVVHAFNRGHVAYLPILTGREMMACDYYHFPMQMVEYNYPPAAIRTVPAKLDAFLAAYGVSMVVTCQDHDNWISYLDSRRDKFERVDPGPGFGFSAYRVKGTGGCFLENSGQLRAGFNHIDVVLNDLEKRAVIGYNWSERFSAEGKAELFPVAICEGVTLVGIMAHGEKTVRIEFKGM